MDSLTITPEELQINEYRNRAWRMEGAGDYAQAAANYEKAAQLGDVLAKFYLAEAYRKGQGLPQDYVKAAQLYEEVAACEDPQIIDDPFEPLIPQCDAAFFLGEMHEKGLLPNASLEAAAAWYRRASDTGNVDGDLKLAQMYLEGKGVEQNYESAAMALVSGGVGLYPSKEFDGVKWEKWIIDTAEYLLDKAPESELFLVELLMNYHTKVAEEYRARYTVLSSAFGEEVAEKYGLAPKDAMPAEGELPF